MHYLVIIDASKFIASGSDYCVFNKNGPRVVCLTRSPFVLLHYLLPSYHSIPHFKQPTPTSPPMTATPIASTNALAGVNGATLAPMFTVALSPIRCAYQLNKTRASKNQIRNDGKSEPHLPLHRFHTRDISTGLGEGEVGR
jgi:hypothetical protein